MVKLLHLTIWSFLIFGLSIANAGSPSSATEKHFTVQRGDIVHATCAGRGENVYWLKPGGNRVRENAQHENIYSITKDGQLLLTITKVDPTDAGEYICRGTRKGEDIRIRLVLEVLESGPPMFEVLYEEVEAYTGINLTLRCKAAGDAPMSYTWFQQYSFAFSGVTPNALVSMEEHYSDLHLISVTEQNHGIYTCTAENYLGRESKLFRVMVKDRSAITDDSKMSIIDVTDTSIRIRFKSTNISREDRFELRMKLADDNGNYTEITGIDTNTYTVSDLLPGGKYVLQSRIWFGGNESGGLWSDEIRVSLSPGPPEIIVRQAADRKFSLEIFRPIYYVSYNTVDRYIIKYRTIQQQSGNSWLYTGCEYTIIVSSCGGSGYEISNLQTNAYYSITIQSEGPGGKSKVSEIKIFSPKLVS